MHLNAGVFAVCGASRFCGTQAERRLGCKSRAWRYWVFAEGLSRRHDVVQLTLTRWGGGAVISDLLGCCQLG